MEMRTYRLKRLVDGTANASETRRFLQEEKVVRDFALFSFLLCSKVRFVRYK